MFDASNMKKGEKKMQNQNGKFISAQMTAPKEGTGKTPRLIINVLFESKANNNSTAGTLQTIWVSPEMSQATWALVKDCEFGDEIEFEAVVEMNGRNARVNWQPITVH